MRRQFTRKQILTWSGMGSFLLMLSVYYFYQADQLKSSEGVSFPTLLTQSRICFYLLCFTVLIGAFLNAYFGRDCQTCSRLIFKTESSCKNCRNLDSMEKANYLDKIANLDKFFTKKVRLTSFYIFLSINIVCYLLFGEYWDSWYPVVEYCLPLLLASGVVMIVYSNCSSCHAAVHRGLEFCRFCGNRNAQYSKYSKLGLFAKLNLWFIFLFLIAALPAGKDFLVLSAIRSDDLERFESQTQSRNKIVSTIDHISFFGNAVLSGSYKVSEFLLAKGADVNQKIILSEFDENSNSDFTYTYPIISAVRNNRIHLTKLLLQYGPDLNLADSNGKTAIDIAKEKNLSDMLKLLQPNSEAPNLMSTLAPVIAITTNYSQRSITNSPVPTECLGYPSSDGKIRLFSQEDCTQKLNGNWYSSGECLKKNGGSYSWDLRDRNSTCQHVEKQNSQR